MYQCETGYRRSKLPQNWPSCFVDRYPRYHWMISFWCFPDFNLAAEFFSFFWTPFHHHQRAVILRSFVNIDHLLVFLYPLAWPEVQTDEYDCDLTLTTMTTNRAIIPNFISCCFSFRFCFLSGRILLEEDKNNGNQKKSRESTTLDWQRLHRMVEPIHIFFLETAHTKLSTLRSPLSFPTQVSPPPVQKLPHYSCVGE